MINIYFILNIFTDRIARELNRVIGRVGGVSVLPNFFLKFFDVKYTLWIFFVTLIYLREKVTPHSTILQNLQ